MYGSSSPTVFSWHEQSNPKSVEHIYYGSCQSSLELPFSSQKSMLFLLFLQDRKFTQRKLKKKIMSCNMFITKYSSYVVSPSIKMFSKFPITVHAFTSFKKARMKSLLFPLWKVVFFLAKRERSPKSQLHPWLHQEKCHLQV